MSSKQMALFQQCRRAQHLNVPCFICVLVMSCIGSSTKAADLLQTAFAAQVGRSVNGRDSSILILDIRSGLSLGGYNAGCLYEPSHSVGSLIKPLTALAYLRDGRLPEPPLLFCPPTAPGAEDLPDCWFHHGHGHIGLPNAIALSCNHYFYKLAQTLDWRSFLKTLSAFHVAGKLLIRKLKHPDDENHRIEVMIGRNGRLQVRPIDLAYAIAALFNDGKLFSVSNEGGTVLLNRINLEEWNVTPVRAGMLESAQKGTGRLASEFVRPIYSKTGTSAINNTGTARARGQLQTEGWCVAVAPDLNPPILVMTRVRPGRGASEAAPLAGESLRIYLHLVSGTP